MLRCFSPEKYSFLHLQRPQVIYHFGHTVWGSVKSNYKPLLLTLCSITVSNLLIWVKIQAYSFMGPLPYCGLRMSWEFRERFPRHRFQRKPLVSDPGMHHGTGISHVPWCMSGSLTRGGGENGPGIPGACVTRNFAYLVRGPCNCKCNRICRL